MFAFLETPSDLRPWVHCIWTHESAASAGRAPPIAPDGCCEWILHLAQPPLALRAGTWRRQPRTYLFGQLQRPLLLHSDRATRCLAVRFKPHAATAILHVPGSALYPEELMFPDLARSLAFLHGLSGVDTVDRAYRSVVAALRRLARDARTFDPLVIAAVEALECNHDEERIAGLARRLGVSSRTLQRRFLDGVGLTPKRFARIARMQQGLRLLALPEASAASVAHTLGYADQAHLTRELMALAGVRPGDVGAPG
ncbi:MAG: AraC family transcriptional regulator [Casimicrobiaceae bacterium]